MTRKKPIAKPRLKDLEVTPAGVQELEAISCECKTLWQMGHCRRLCRLDSPRLVVPLFYQADKDPT